MFVHVVEKKRSKGIYQRTFANEFKLRRLFFCCYFNKEEMLKNPLMYSFSIEGE